MNRILALKDLGLSLVQIQAMLDETVSPEEIRGMLRLKQAEIQQHVDEEQARLVRVASRLKQIEQEGKMPQNEVILKEIEEQRVLSIREIAPTIGYMVKVLGECVQAVMSQQIEMVGVPYSLYYDAEFKPTDFDFEVAFPVAANAPHTIPLGKGRQLTAKALPALPTAASTLHEGGYDSIETAYLLLGQWIQDNHYKIVGAAHEIYLRAPQDGVPLTEILFPIEKG